MWVQLVDCWGTLSNDTACACKIYHVYTYMWYSVCEKGMHWLIHTILLWAYKQIPHTLQYEYIHPSMGIHLYVHTHMYNKHTLHTYMHMYTQMYTHARTCTHTRAHKCTHTYTEALYTYKHITQTNIQIDRHIHTDVHESMRFTVHRWWNVMHQQ